ncbi:Dioxygenase, partial [Geosmithia morbida]
AVTLPGIYSDVASGGNYYTDAPENTGNIFLRSPQLTDLDGSVEGRYPQTITDRTMFDVTASYVGQVYSDQDFIYQVETQYSPYICNQQPFTLSADDSLLAGGIAIRDLVVQYTFQGEEVSGGILAWLPSGVNAAHAADARAAAICHAGGGQNNDVVVVVVVVVLVRAKSSLRLSTLIFRNYLRGYVVTGLGINVG